MKTLTEFPGPILKTAAKTKQDLVTAGKTAEELPAAMGEALKAEGDRLTLLMSALEVLGKELEDLKRIVVYTAAEGEKTPSNLKLVGDKYFLVEYYPPLNPPKKGGKERGRFPGRGEKGRGKKGGKRGGGRGRDKDQRGPGGGGGRDRRPPRNPDQQRPQIAAGAAPTGKVIIQPKAPGSTPGKIVIKPKTATTPPPATETAPTETSSKTEA